ncbi:unnamed protein product [Closterium sp. NIES-65]|nr:unnamed protein product [Closterium sp. NIES-65]
MKVLLLTKEERLESYRENERERLEFSVGLTMELQGEVPLPYLSAKVKMRKEPTLIEEVQFKGERYSGSQAGLKATSTHFAYAFKADQATSQPARNDFALDRVMLAEAADRLRAPWTEPEVKAALEGLPKGKSLGQDGIPAELFVTHWDLLGREQHGFIPGRSLADAVAVVADLIEVVENDGEDWYLLLVDFQKA